MKDFARRELRAPSEFPLENALVALDQLLRFQLQYGIAFVAKFSLGFLVRRRSGPPRRPFACHISVRGFASHYDVRSESVCAHTPFSGAPSSVLLTTRASVCGE